MSYPVALSKLISSVRQRTNLEGATAFVTDNEITDYINGSVSEWYDEVRATTWNGEYFTAGYEFQTSPTNAVQGTLQSPPPGSLYQLPKNFVSLISCDVFISPNLPIAALPFTKEQRNMFRWWPIGWVMGNPVFYRLQGRNICFIPAPQSIFSVHLSYVPTAPLLFNGDDEIHSINGWEEFIILDASIKVLMKDGQLELIPVMQQRLEQQRERIRAMAASRDQVAAEPVHEIERDFNFLYF